LMPWRPGIAASSSFMTSTGSIMAKLPQCSNAPAAIQSPNYTRPAGCYVASSLQEAARLPKQEICSWCRARRAYQASPQSREAPPPPP
jgi:hypothetical protein